MMMLLMVMILMISSFLSYRICEEDAGERMSEWFCWVQVADPEGRLDNKLTAI